MPRTLALQNQVRSTTSGVEYDDTLSLALAETIVNEAFLTDPTQVSGTLIMDMNFIRTAIRDIKGATPTFDWFDPASTASTATLIDLSEARTEITNLQSFTGSDGDGDATPDYGSLCFISQNDPLETAVSTLDEQLCIATGTISAGQEIQKLTLIRTGGQVAEDTGINIDTPGAGWDRFGDNINITSSGIFIEDSSVYTNGLLQLNGPDAAANHDVYFVSSDVIAFEYKLKQNDIIQIFKFPPS